MCRQGCSCHKNCPYINLGKNSRNMEIIKDRLFALAQKYVEETGVSVFLTGKAGTGKTTFLRHIVESTSKRAVVLAPTGVAAINAQGSTIHSFFGLPLCPYLPDVKELKTEYQMPDRFRRMKREKERIIKTMDLLIIDEISMVRADVLDAVDMTLRRVRHSALPFGGVQLLMIGDAQQLSPVVTEQERPYLEQVYPSPYFFHSKALAGIKYVTIELQTIYRQEDTSFIEILNAVRDQHLSPAQLALLNSRVGAPYTDDWIRLTTHNAQADAVNAQRLRDLPTPEHTYMAKTQGDYPEPMYPAPSELVLKEGARVMFLRNDPEGRFYNGKIATVKLLGKDDITVLDDEGKTIPVEPLEWENLQYSLDESSGEIVQKAIGSFCQFPLRPAWAITIHKSQGLTFDHVIIDAGAAFAFGQVYVALSRCRSLEGISLTSPITPNVLFEEADVAAFHASFPTVSSISQALPAFQQQFADAQRASCFTFESLRLQLCLLRKVWREHVAKSQSNTLALIEDACSKVIEAENVATRFRRQLQQLSANRPSLLPERCTKAAGYFLPILKDLPITQIGAAEIGNSDARQRIMRIFQDLKPQWEMHCKTLTDVLENGFVPERFRSIKNRALLGETASSSTAKRSGSRTSAKKGGPAPKKIPTREQSLLLYQEGLSLSDIAHRRELGEATVFDHLLTFVKTGEVDLADLIPEDHIAAVIDFYSKHTKITMLTPCYEALDKTIPYDEIRAIRKYMLE